MQAVHHPHVLLNQRTIEHLRPVDSVLSSLQNTSCGECQYLLTRLLIHLEEDIPAVTFEEGRS